MNKNYSPLKIQQRSSKEIPRTKEPQILTQAEIETISNAINSLLKQILQNPTSQTSLNSNKNEPK
jgi:hypothetical protein